MSSEFSITKLEGNILTDWQTANKDPLNAVANGRMWNQRAVIMGSIAVATSIAQAVIPYTPFAASAAFAMPFMAPVVAITSALTFFAGLIAFKNLSTPPEFLSAKIKETVVTDTPETVNKLQTATQQLEEKSKTLTIKCMTCNAAGKNDMHRLMEKQNEANKKNNEPLTFPDTSPEIAAQRYAKITSIVFQELLSVQQPDIITFQELFPDDSEKKNLCSQIEKQGYKLVSSKSLAVAYKADKFEQLYQDQTNQNLERRSRAFYVVLKDKSSNKVICAVADHLRGFSAKNQKEIRKGLKDNINPLTKQKWDTERQKAGAKDTIAFAKEEGDRAIMGSLSDIEKIQSEHNVDLVIYGLDANSTTKDLEQHRLHPKRLRQFDSAHFKHDKTDTAPTIIDHELDVPTKYDYIFAKAMKPGLEVEIHSKAVGEEPNQFAKIYSDHRPVVADISLKGEVKSQRWSFFSFFSNRS